MKQATAIILAIALSLSTSAAAQSSAGISGARTAAQPAQWEKQFLAAPDAKRAEQHLRELTRAPHMAGTAEDKQTAEYVAQKYREAGLQTEILEYKVWMGLPTEVSVEITAPAGVNMRGPTPERVEGDPFQDDRRVVMAHSGYSPSGEVEAEVVYANYGSPQDLRKLKDLGVDVRGKILLVRYGQNFRGVKSFVAQEQGAAAVIIYSDPIDDGWSKGDKYPKGPWRPDSGVQRGSVLYIFETPGDPTTPGVASLPDLPMSKRIAAERSPSLPKIPTTPLSYADARPILENLGGPESPRAWQGALPFTYHLGPGPVRVKMRVRQEYGLRTIWNVIGKIEGAEYRDEWVVAGNHRDAWVYGAVDPNSGTAAQLEAVHGLGQLLKAGWRPKRTIVIASWDAEEQGLIGSTEWVEQHARELAGAAAYVNIDSAVSGPKFGASAVPSLKQFLRDIAKAVPGAKGGTVYDAWQKGREKEPEPSAAVVEETATSAPPQEGKREVRVGDLGSGSDYTAFLQHLGVPSSDVTSSGAYGVYHSVFDNFAWFKKFADPEFLYTQQMARVYGVQILRLASADVLPFDYEQYGKEVGRYIEAARKKAEKQFGAKAPNFAEAAAAAKRFQAAGVSIAETQRSANADARTLNRALLAAERALLLPGGLPTRPWFRHAIYAPGRYTGYAAVTLPGVNDALDRDDLEQARNQITALAAALSRAAQALENVKPGASVQAAGK